MSKADTGKAGRKAGKRRYLPALLALGGNLGDRQANIVAAVEAIDATKGIHAKLLSPMVESFAVTQAGVDESKPNYINAVLRIETRLKPKKLLRELRRIESELGRIRVERWGSRTIDIDIITYADRVIAKKKLEVPHPRAFGRAFVMVPWAMIEPDAVLPGHGRVATLAEPIINDVWVVK
jgi:2-amino-4-hydroxy-6-hydroxymethyldihydropteridine diphosphokinase